MPKIPITTSTSLYRLALGAILVFGTLDVLGRLFLPAETMICNQGIGWSIPLSPRWAISFGVIALGVLGYLVFREQNKLKKLGWLLLMMGGGINTGERILSGCVHDYFHLGLFPSFNVADMMLTLGVGVLMWSLLRRQA